MKVACTGDWHIHAFADFSKKINVEWDKEVQRFVESDSAEAKEMSSRLFNILDGICDLRDYCIQNNIQTVLNAGDVFHKRGTITVDTFNSAYQVVRSFDDCGISLFIIAGNHDQTDASDSPTTSIHTFSDVASIIEDCTTFRLTDKCSVVAIPYFRNKKKVTKYLNEHCSKDNILLAHLGVTGGVVGSGMYMMSDDFSMKDLKYDKWKYVVLGHYHRPQLLAHNTIYCGTPVQNSFNDEIDAKEDGGYNGFFVLDTDRRWDIQFVPIKKPRFITLHSADELKTCNKDNYYRIKGDAKYSEELTKALTDNELECNVKMELEKDYAALERSSIGIADTFEEAVKKYASEHYSGESDNIVALGLEILAEATIGGN